MALHESQSRFYENHIGKNPAFWVKQFPKLQELFPKDLETVSYDDFISYINMAQRSKIRIDADELTYPFHIIIRYEIEKKLFLGELTVSQLPDYWNKLYKSYLGVSIDNDAQGVLQDIHWSNGSFGYFPTYVLGSAYAAQLYFALSRQIDIAKDLQEGNFEAINSWLNDNVRTHGSFKTATEIIKAATKEEFNPKYYIGYLKEKYR
jgi:carboxypeptidase Taq